MSSSNLIMVHISACFQELWPFVYEKSSLKQCPLSKLNSFDQNFMKLDTLFSAIMSPSISIMVHIAPCFLELLPFVHEN